MGISAAQATVGEAGSSITPIFLWIALILLLAKLAGLVERFGQPAVLGELVVGLILGNLTLVGFDGFEPVVSNDILHFLAQLGVVILLFQVGLETRVSELRQVGWQAILVAVIGVILPFVLGAYLVGPLLLPDNSVNTYLFLGATLTPTSVGITTRVFRDLGRLQGQEAKIVLGAAVIDDVLAFIVVAAVSAIVTAGSVSLVEIIWIVVKVILFLGGAIVLGQFLAPEIGDRFSKINRGIGMKVTLALGSALILAYVAQIIGLAPVIGAFTAGLILDPVHFRSFKDPQIVADVRHTLQEADPMVRNKVEQVLQAHAEHHVAGLIEPIGFVLVPLFFVMTGMAVNLETLANPSTLLIALGLTLLAVVSKITAGWGAGKGVSRSIVGWGMVPRGEVVLVCASIGRSLGVLSDDSFSIIIIMVILTTLLTPPVLTYFLKRRDNTAVRKAAGSRSFSGAA